MPPHSGLNTTSDGQPDMSWGASILQGDDCHTGNSCTWHMWAAQFVNHCGLNQWYCNSRIIHAVADSVDGAYHIVDVTVPVWAHNPAVTRGPKGEWVMTYVANRSATTFEAECKDGHAIRNSSQSRLWTNNYMSVATSPYGPWAEPIPIDGPFDQTVPPFVMQGVPNHNTNLVMSIQKDGAMVGLWRRCCDPPKRYQPPGGGGTSVVFGVYASNWSDVSTWQPNATAILPQLPANGYEDPYLWPDPKRPGVYHAVFHDMVGGWHRPEFNNTQVGSHAYSIDGGRTWHDTGIAFNLIVHYTDGSETTFIRRERPHIVLNQAGQPVALSSGATYSLLETLPSSSIVQPIAHD